MKNEETIRSKITIYIFLTIIFPLILGFLLYYILYPDIWFVKRIDSLLNLNRTLNDSTSQITLPNYIRNYLFDFLWSFSFTNAIFFSLDKNMRIAILSPLISVLTGTILELTQLAQIIYGTFDLFDIVTEIIGAVIAAFIIKISRGYILK